MDVQPKLVQIHQRLQQSRSLDLVLVGAFTIAFFIATSHLASRKPLWTDELLVSHATRAPTLRQVFATYAHMPDSMPPAIYVAVYAVGKAFGYSELTLRLPSMAGYWLMCLSIYGLLRRRFPPLVAAVGMVLPVCTETIVYAYETRGYGLELGFCGVAMLCWDACATTKWRRWALFGLTLTLTLAVFCHLYACLFYVALALAELARSRRKLDWAIWGCFALASALAVGLLLPVLPNIMKVAWIGTGNADLLGLVAILSSLVPTGLTCLGLLTVAALAASWSPRPQPEPGADDAQPQQAVAFADWALAVALMAIPLIAFIMITATNGVVILRYVLPSVMGFCLLGVLVTGMAVQRRPELAVLLVVWVALAATFQVVDQKHQLLELSDLQRGRGRYRLLAVADQIPQDRLPIVVSDFHTYMQLDHYAPPALRERLVHIPDSNLWIRQLSPIHERVLGQRMPSLEAFVRDHQRFYLYDPYLDPLVANLIHSGAVVKEMGVPTPYSSPRVGSIFVVTLPPP